MTIELDYDAENDADVSAKSHLETDGYSVDIEAATNAGRREIDSPQKPNEDAFGAVQWGQNVVLGVFDGASSQKPIPEIEPTTGARFASHALKEILESMPENSDLGAALSNLNRELGEQFEKFPSIDLTDINSLPSSTTTLVRINFDKNALNIAHVSDSFAIALHTDDSTSLLTDNLHRQFDEKVLGLIAQIAAEQGISAREAKNDARVKSAIMAMHQHARNRVDGTGSGSANGDPNMDQYIYTRSLDLSNVSAIIVGSDGLVPPGMDESVDTDRKKMFAIASKVGITGLIAYTRETEDEDPDWQHVRYKHADDATGILVRLRRQL